ncbi:hypothetical protein H312_01115 [Anncaliia algerae PRA339]|uniref:Uncharacterized protein n=1 Tax=Anncaliia algerae PRA339 TaxID=1288291 RepID=A0A059F2D9_9MICR|nr:hypothetical protein H312_01115 [Anncaliia algerae PRA339]
MGFINKITSLKVKSIYLNYLRYGHTHEGYIKLNSIFEKKKASTLMYDKTNSSEDSITNPETLTFDYTITGTDIRLKRNMTTLTSLNIDLFNWIADFRELVSLCSWTE